MSRRPITLFTGQWADLPFAEVCQLASRWGYDGSNHLTGQAVCDHPIDERHQAILSFRMWGDGEPEGVRRRAAQDMKDTARTAARLGVSTVVGFTGSSIWHTVAMFDRVGGRRHGPAHRRARGPCLR